MSLKDRIHDLRLQAGLSASGLAAKVGVSPTCVWNWEQGNTHPRPHNVMALAAALRVPSEVITGDAPISAAQPAVEGRPETVDAILERAKQQIAVLLKLPATRIQLSFSVAA